MKIYKILLGINFVVAIFVLSQVGYYTFGLQAKQNLGIYFVISLVCIIDVIWSVFQWIKNK